MKINIKRVYDTPEKEDGFRILVDRLWPRGLTKQKAAADLWLKEMAPTAELRKWFAHDPEKWNEFFKKYTTEIKANNEGIATIKAKMKEGSVTLLYGARDTEHNEAKVLQEYFSKK